MSHKIADEMTHFKGERVTVVGRGSKRGDSSVMAALHEGIVVGRVKHPPGPWALDVVLAERTNRGEYPFCLFERLPGDVRGYFRRGLRRLHIAHVKALAMAARVKAWVA